jgi:hypothetical protein
MNGPRNSEIFYITFDCYNLYQALTRTLSVLPGTGQALEPSRAEARARAGLYPQEINIRDPRLHGNKITNEDDCLKLTDVSEVLTASSISLMMEAVSISETLVNFYETTLRNIPEDSYLDTRRRENLKSHKVTNILEK